MIPDGRLTSGKVGLIALGGGESAVYDLRRPVRAVAFDPTFARKSAHTIVSGGLAGTLIAHERGWLGVREHVLTRVEGAIYAISWRGNSIVFASDDGIHIVQSSNGARMGFLTLDEDAPRPDLFPCRFSWPDDATLLIAWANTLKIVSIRTKEKPPVVLTEVFSLDTSIAGVVMVDSNFGILTVGEDSPPQLRIVSKSGEELSADVLDAPENLRIRPEDYHLCQCSDGRMLANAPGAIYVVSQRTAADHVVWLLGQSRIREAYTLVDGIDLESMGLTKTDIGQRYLQNLVDDGSAPISYVSQQVTL